MVSSLLRGRDYLNYKYYVTSVLSRPYIVTLDSMGDMYTHRIEQ